MAVALAYLCYGDVLAVWRLVQRLNETIRPQEARGVGFRSLTASIDTATKDGRLIFNLFGALE